MSINLTKNIVFLRKREKLNQAEIQDRLGFKRNTWSNWENGISTPDLSTLMKIAAFFNVGIADLIEGDLESSVHLNKNRKGAIIDKNVHLNVHPSVHLNDKKGAYLPNNDNNVTLLEDSITPPQSEQNLVETMAVAIRGLERANSRLEQLVERLEEENMRLKQALPEIGQDLEAGNARAS